MSVGRQHNCIISRQHAAAKGGPPACVNREQLCERLFCEPACLAANLNGCIRSDAKIRGLLRDTVCVNSLFFWRVYKMIRDAFKTMERELRRVVDKQRRDVKTHADSRSPK